MIKEGGGDKGIHVTKCLATFYSNTNKKSLYRYCCMVNKNSFVSFVPMFLMFLFVSYVLICFLCSYLFLLFLFAPSPPMTPCSTPSLHTVYVQVLIYRGMGGGGLESWTREKVRGATVHKSGSKIPTCISSLSTLINTCRKVPLQVNFLDDDILLWCLYR